MPAPMACPELDVLLPRFVCGDPEVASEFPRIARPLLTKFANRFGWFLASDRREEIVQQALLLLIGPAGRKFNPRQSSAKAFLRLIARRASREVGAMYTVPGNRTRSPKRRGSEVEPSPMVRVIPLEDLKEHEAPAVEGPERTVEIRHDVAAILAAAPAGVAHALSRIYLEDVPRAVVAAEMCISRFALARAIDKFAGTLTV